MANNTASAKASGSVEVDIEGFRFNMPDVLPTPISVTSLKGTIPAAVALGGGTFNDGSVSAQKAVFENNAALAEGGIAAAVGGAFFMSSFASGNGPLTAEFRGNRAEALGSQQLSLTIEGLKLNLPSLPAVLNGSLNGSVAAAMGGAGVADFNAVDPGSSALFVNNHALADGSLAAAVGGATYAFEANSANKLDKITFTGNWAAARNTTGISLQIEDSTVRNLLSGLAASAVSDPDQQEAVRTLANAALNADSTALAAGGAVFSPAEDMYAGQDIRFNNNRVSAEGAIGIAAGGAVADVGTVTLSSDGSITFAGNKAEGSTAGLGGAVYSLGGVNLNAGKRVAFMTNTDDVVFGSSFSSDPLKIKASMLFGIKGVELADQKTALTEAGIAENIVSFIAGSGSSADLTEADAITGEKGNPGELFTVRAASATLKDDSDAKVFGASSDGRQYFFTADSPATTGGENFTAKTYRDAAVGYDTAGTARHYYIDIRGTKDIVWSGNASDSWYAGNAAEQNWLEGTANEHFYNADRVTFNDSAAKYVVKVTDSEVLPGTMTVAGTKDYAFVSAADSSNTIGTSQLSLTGTGKTYFENLDVLVSDGFTAQAGSQLVADGPRTAEGSAVVRSSGNAALNVEKGASLLVQNAELNKTYWIADGFTGSDSAKNWNAQPYAGTIFDKAALAYTDASTWNPITDGYVTLWDDGAVTFTDRFRMETDPAALLSLANTALTLSRSFAATLNERVYSRQNAAADLSSLVRMSFVPDAKQRAADKGVWGSIWYSHNDVDGMPVTGETGWFDQDTTTKSYGATIGGDFTRRGFTTGLAVQLGKYDSDGALGADGDGKFIGASLYGGFKRGAWEFTGDVGYNWFDTDVTARLSGQDFRADGIKGHVLTAGVRANWHLPARGALQVTPFLGLRFSRYDQDAYDLHTDYIVQTIRAEDCSMDQWTLPLGVRFDWLTEAHGEWTLRPSVELAYVRAFGDTDIDSRLRVLGSGSTLPAMDFVTAVNDENSFRAAVRFEGKRKNMTLGLNLSGLFSDNQTDFGVGATVRWDF